MARVVDPDGRGRTRSDLLDPERSAALIASGERELRGRRRPRAAADAATDHEVGCPPPSGVDAADRDARWSSSSPQSRLRDLPIERRIHRARPVADSRHQNQPSGRRVDQSHRACTGHQRLGRLEPSQPHSRRLVPVLFDSRRLLDLIDAHLRLRHERMHHDTAQGRDHDANRPESHQPPTALNATTSIGVDQLEVRTRRSRRQPFGRARLEPVRCGPAGSESGSTRNALWRARHDF